MSATDHQYIDRETGQVHNEFFWGDGALKLLYSPAREHAPTLFRLLTSRRFTSCLATLNYDIPLTSFFSGYKRYLRNSGVKPHECLEDLHNFRTARQFFERRIHYQICRPMPDRADIVVSPADARILTGSLNQKSGLFVKQKFFALDELLDEKHACWSAEFSGGDFAVLRLTPDKYHYNHTPVAGRVLDIYSINGACHSCNPVVTLSIAAPLSKNARMVTVIDTDEAGGTGVGLVAMVEVAALMIGEIVQCYSTNAYDSPQPIQRGMWIERGYPKSLFRPGSSTDVLLFQRDRVSFAEDILLNMRRPGIRSRFAEGLGRPLVETDVNVRSMIAMRR